MKFRLTQQMQDARAHIGGGMQTEAKRGLTIHPFNLLPFVEDDHTIRQCLGRKTKAIQCKIQFVLLRLTFAMATSQGTKHDIPDAVAHRHWRRGA